MNTVKIEDPRRLELARAIIKSLLGKEKQSAKDRTVEPEREANAHTEEIKASIQQLLRSADGAENGH